MDSTSDVIVVGRLVAVHGIKGWLKVRSYTEPFENIFKYQPWLLNTAKGFEPFHIDQWQSGSKGFLAKMIGVDDRQQAESLSNLDVNVEKTRLSALAAGQYYWHQLQGLHVISEFNGNRYHLGTVKHLFSTGANDVLIVQGDSCSIDQRERLIPYVPGQYVKKVDLDSGIICVEWSPEF